MAANAAVPVDDLVTAFLIAFLILVAWLTVGYVREQRALRRETRRMHEWEQEIAGVTLPSYNGATYDWPTPGLARYLDSFPDPDSLLQEPGTSVPVPASRISGPMRVLDPTSDTEVFIATLRAQTDHFIALMDEPLEVTS